MVSGKFSSNDYLFVLFLGLFVCAVVSNYYHFFYKEDYNYLVRVECDQKIEQCLLQECGSVDVCDLLSKEYYKEYYVKALDYYKCLNRDCPTECKSTGVCSILR